MIHLKNFSDHLNEGKMSTLDIIAQEAQDLDSFISDAFSEFPKLKEDEESSKKWLTDIYSNRTNQ